MGDVLCFNNKLSFLKSVTTLIVPFFLGIKNVESREDNSEEQSSSRSPMSTNLTISLTCCSCCFTDLGALCARAWISLQLGSISWRLIDIFSMLNSPNVPSKRCSYFWVISWVDAVPLHGGSHMSWSCYLNLLTHNQHQEFWCPKNIPLLAFVVHSHSCKP
jgi:hypothetical protein